MYLCKRFRNFFFGKFLDCGVCVFFYIILFYRRVRYVFFRGEIVKFFFLFWVDWYWGGYLGYSFCLWYWVFIFFICVYF